MEFWRVGKGLGEWFWAVRTIYIYSRIKCCLHEAQQLLKQIPYNNVLAVAGDANQNAKNALWVLPICPFTHHSFGCHRCFLFPSYHLFLFQMLDDLHRFGSDDVFLGVIDSTVSFVLGFNLHFSSFTVFCPSLYLFCRIASQLESRMTAHLNKGGYVEDFFLA